MSRRKYVDPRVKWHIYIPSTLAAQIELLLLDPFLGQPKFGAKSELVTSLLQKWLDDKWAEQAVELTKPEPEGKSDDN
jgi:hypothetical protein